MIPSRADFSRFCRNRLPFQQLESLNPRGVRLAQRRVTMTIALLFITAALTALAVRAGIRRTPRKRTRKRRTEYLF